LGGERVINWKPHPNPLAVSQRASQLLAPLWTMGEGTHVVEKHGGQDVLFCAQWHGSKKGITAYIPSWDNPAAPAPAPSTPVNQPGALRAFVLLATVAIVGTAWAFVRGGR
jgi:hypothetical protein